MTEDATPLVEALLEIIEASRVYLPGEMSKDAFVTKVLEAVDNPKIIAALAAHGHPVAGVRRYRRTSRKTIQMMVTRKPSQIVSMTSCLRRSGVNQIPPRESPRASGRCLL
jgi:hypothetical protein